MRLVHTVLLTVTTMIAAMAVTATSAFAQSIEVLNEDTGTHCAEITELTNHDVDGGCEVTVPSAVNLETFSHDGVQEVMTASCESELIIVIDEAGTGYVDVDEDTIHTDAVAGCSIEECDEAAPNHSELEWPINGLLEYGGEQEEMIFTFCLRTVHDAEGTGLACTIIVDVDQDHLSADHHTMLSADQEPCHENPVLELSGQWETTHLEDEIELVHHHYPGDSVVAP